MSKYEGVNVIQKKLGIQTLIWNEPQIKKKKKLDLGEHMLAKVIELVNVNVCERVSEWVNGGSIV